MSLVRSLLLTLATVHVATAGVVPRDTCRQDTKIIADRTCQTSCGTDRPGGNIAQSYTGTWDACVQACGAEPNCVSAQYVADNGFCYLKGVRNNLVTNSNVDTVDCDSSVSSPVTPTCAAGNRIIAGRTCQVSCGTDRSGGDYGLSQTGSLDGCVQACAADSNCVTAQYNGGFCYFKSIRNPESSNSNVDTIDCDALPTISSSTTSSATVYNTSSTVQSSATTITTVTMTSSENGPTTTTTSDGIGSTSTTVSTSTSDSRSTTTIVATSESTTTAQISSTTGTSSITSQSATSSSTTTATTSDSLTTQISTTTGTTSTVGTTSTTTTTATANPSACGFAVDAPFKIKPTAGRSTIDGTYMKFSNTVNAYSYDYFWIPGASATTGAKFRLNADCSIYSNDIPGGVVGMVSASGANSHNVQFFKDIATAQTVSTAYPWAKLSCSVVGTLLRCTADNAGVFTANTSFSNLIALLKTSSASSVVVTMNIVPL